MSKLVVARPPRAARRALAPAPLVACGRRLPIRFAAYRLLTARGSLGKLSRGRTALHRCCVVSGRLRLPRGTVYRPGAAVANEVICPRILFCPAESRATQLRKGKLTWSSRFGAHACLVVLVGPFAAPFWAACTALGPLSSAVPHKTSCSAFSYVDVALSVYRSCRAILAFVGPCRTCRTKVLFPAIIIAPFRPRHWSLSGQSTCLLRAFSG